jgi:hypothetical protein
MTTRREIVGGLTLMLGGACACGASGQSRSGGCQISRAAAGRLADRATAQFKSGSDTPILQSGDRDFDFALAQTLGKISDCFGVSPGFAYYDDFEGGNAFASDRVQLNGADGTVLFGKRLLREFLSGDDNPELMVAAVCAHEFGHILQYKYGLADRVNAGQPTVKRSELQADFFAGYFAGVRKLERPNFPAAVFAQAQWAAGDNAFSSREHHGTNEERGEAVVQGFYAAHRDRRTLSEAITFSTAYVSRL